MHAMDLEKRVTDLAIANSPMEIRAEVQVTASAETVWMAFVAIRNAMGRATHAPYLLKSKV
jgi:hypothetical protein